MKKKICLAAAGVLSLSFGVGCSTQQEETALTPVRLNEVVHSVFYAPQYVAIANGYFEEEGLNIEITTGQGADKVMTAVLAGQSDIGFARTRSCYLCV